MYSSFFCGMPFIRILTESVKCHALLRSCISKSMLLSIELNVYIYIYIHMRAYMYVMCACRLKYSMLCRSACIVVTKTRINERMSFRCRIERLRNLTSFNSFFFF